MKISKRIILIFLLGVNFQSFAMQSQPKSLTCQALKTAVDDALKAGNTDQLAQLPDAFLVPATYLYEAKNNPTVALFNSYADLHYYPKLHERSHPDVVNLLRPCADSGLVNKIVERLNTSAWDSQNAFRAIVSNSRYYGLKAIEVFVLSKLRGKIDLDKIFSLVNMSDTSALLRAIEAGDIALVRILIDAGAKVNLPNVYKLKPYTPLMMAVHSAVIKRRSDRGETAILNHYKEIIKLLIESGADINATTGDFNSAIQEAKYDKQLVEFLKENKVKIKKDYSIEDEDTEDYSCLKEEPYIGNKKVLLQDLSK